MPETAPKSTKAEILSSLSERTGLSRNTVKELMKNGWTFFILNGKGHFIEPKGQ